MKHSAMAGLPYTISLLLLAVAPQLCAIQVSEPGQVRLFGKDSLSVAGNLTFEWYGALLNAGEEGIGTPRLWGHLILREQSERGFIQFTLLGWDDDVAKVVLLVDNLYIIGFADKDDNYFVLKQYKHLMPGATELDLGDAYSKLFGVGFASYLPTLALGQIPFLEAVRTLANSPTVEKAGPAMGTFAVMISESLRLTPIRARLNEIWESGATGFLDDEIYAKYIQNWGKLSRLVLCSAGGEPFRGKAAGHLRDDLKITTREEALEILNIIIWPKYFDPNNLWASCGDPPKLRPSDNERRRPRRQGPPPP